MSSSTPGHVGGIDRQDGDVRPAQLVDRGLRGQAVRVGDDEVGAEGHDLLDVDALVGGHDRHGVGGRRVLGDVLDLADHAVAGADREQDLGGGRRERHDLLRLGRQVDRGALVVGQGEREGGRRLRGRTRLGRAGVTGDERGGRVGRDRHGRRAGAGARGDDEDDTEEQRRRAAGRARQTPRGPAGEGSGTGSRMPTLSLEGSSMTSGSATGLARSARALRPGRRDHRSGTVPGSHRLRDPAVWRMRLTGRLYHLPGTTAAR